MIFNSVGCIFYFKQFVLLERRMFQILKLLIQVFLLLHAYLYHLTLEIAVVNLILIHHLLTKSTRVLLKCFQSFHKFEVGHLLVLQLMRKDLILSV